MKFPEHARIVRGALATKPGDPCGAFLIRRKTTPVILRALVSSADSPPLGHPAWGWDHVSIVPANRDRAPTWEEMCFVKSLFWDDEEAVMQLHPPRSQWVNNHPNCLHLWRPVHLEIPMPDPIMVGVKEWGTL